MHGHLRWRRRWRRRRWRRRRSRQRRLLRQVTSSVCWVCCEGGLLLHTGCACRGSAGLAHMKCLVKAAEHNVDSWTDCPTCKQLFTGEVHVGLARARWERVHHRPLEDPERLFVANNLAVALLEAAGDPTGAAELLEEVLAVRRRVLGDTHEATMDCLTNLALVYTEAGNFAAALPLSEEAVALTRRTQMNTREEEAAHAIGSLAAVHHHTGNHSQARPLHEEALNIRLRILGKDHLDTMNSMHCLGQSLVATGEHAPGLQMLEKVVDTARRVLGESHESSLHFAQGLADARAGRNEVRPRHRRR